ncbi:MAG: DNA polymerase III subunit beta [Gallionella sp.]|nr:DNA polymerase III subunit beta [Gallionella sp.]MDD4945386.1 DNA polymerase III subunit beta [Gallionella sp.]
MFIQSIEKEALLKPLQIVVGVVERKQTMPILSNILIEKELGIVKFTATDLEIQISTNIETEDTSNSSVTLAGKKLLDILRILPDQSSVTIDVKESRAQIKSGKSRFNLQTLPAQDFPKLNNQIENSSSVTIPQKLLKALFSSIQYAMAQQDVRYYLNGVLLGVDGNKLFAVATDGHRLAYNATRIHADFPKQEIIIPRKAVMELAKLLTDDDGDIEIIFSEQQLKANFSGIQLSTKLIEGKFPDYDRVIPSYTNHLNINRLVVQQALQRAAILSNEKFRGVRFVLTERNLSVISSNSEQEEAQIEIETDYHGDALDIGFNVNYLLEGLNSVNSEQVIFSFGSPNSSILITSPENQEFRYVVMPMRI